MKPVDATPKVAAIGNRRLLNDHATTIADLTALV